MEDKKKIQVIGLVGVIIALIALIPAFGQWLAPDILDSKRNTTTTMPVSTDTSE